MKLCDIVVEQAILPNLQATKRDDVVAELIGALVEAGTIPDALSNELRKAVIKREEKASTGLGHGVAVPHVKHSTIEQLKIAVGVSRAGVDFNSLDRKPVFSIFLLLSPADRPEDHLDAMQAIFKNLGEETFRRFLRQASSVEEVMTLLKEADDRQLVH